jgi:hypothetical protein
VAITPIEIDPSAEATSLSAKALRTPAPMTPTTGTFSFAPFLETSSNPQAVAVLQAITTALDFFDSRKSASAPISFLRYSLLPAAA